MRCYCVDTEILPSSAKRVNSLREFLLESLLERKFQTGLDLLERPMYNPGTINRKGLSMPGCKKCGTLESTSDGVCLACCGREITRLRAIVEPLDALLNGVGGNSRVEIVRNGYKYYAIATSGTISIEPQPMYARIPDALVAAAAERKTDES